MYKIAVLGDWDSIFGFGALGLDTFPVSDKEEAAKKLHELADGEYAVIFVTEALAKEIDSDIVRYASEELPAIILIPGASGNTGEGLSAMKRCVIKAVGSDIIFGNED